MLKCRETCLFEQWYRVSFWYSLKLSHLKKSGNKFISYPGADSEILKGGRRWGALYVGHHGWPTKKILGFRWFKKAKITLETIVFWRNIYNSIFKFSPFLYAMKLTDEIFSIFQNLQMLWQGKRKNIVIRKGKR